MQIVVFEDLAVPRLNPVTLGRPAYAITCGSYRLIDWIAQLGGEFSAHLRGVVRPHLVEIQKHDFSALNPQAKALTNGRSGALFVNARAVPSVGTYETLKQIITDQRPGIIRAGDHIAAALLTHDAPPLPTHLDPETVIDYLAALAPRLSPLDTALPLLT